MGPSGLEHIKATFDWRKFQAGLDLSEVKIDVTHEILAEEAATGTTLHFNDLADTWTANDLREIQGELNALIDPLEHEGYVHRESGGEPDPGITTMLEVPEFPEFEGTIDDRFLEAAWGVLKGRVTEEGQSEYVLDIAESGARLHHDPSALVFADLAGATFTIRMMVYSANRFRGSGYRVGDARTFGRERGGVRIYLDKFRVFSYGAAGDDWLDLDQDGARRLTTTPAELVEEAGGLRRPMLSLPGNMQLFGSVAISREKNLGIAVSISRERLVQNESFEHLKSFVRGGINWMTVCYARDLAASRPDERTPDHEVRTPVQALERAQELVRQEAGISRESRVAIGASLAEATTLLKKERYFDSGCVSCHTTGLGYATGFQIGDQHATLKGVQCETCHGPGKQHVGNPKKTNIRSGADTALCLECHDTKHSPGFAEVAALHTKDVAHSREPMNLEELLASRIARMGKPTLELFVMSFCPFGVQAEEKIIPIVKAFGDKIDFKLRFIAQEKEAPSTQDITPFTSLHGYPEVAENIRQLLIAREYPDRYLDYILCRGKKLDKSWEDCAEKLGIDVAKIQRLFNTQEAEQLFRENIKRSAELGIGASPTILVDNRQFRATQLLRASGTPCQ